MRILDERGSVSIIAALAGLPILLAAGMAIDYSSQMRLRTELQQAVDVAALAGTIAKKNTNTERQSHAENALAANFDWPGSNPNSTFAFRGARTTVTTTVTHQNAFMQLAGINTSEITVRAVADSGLETPICILSLEPDDTKAVLFNSGSSITAPDCAVQVNSTDHEALFANSGSTVKSKATCIVGNYQKNSGSKITPTPDIRCPAVADPLSSLPPPAQASDPCTYDDVVAQGGETRRFAPGVYCQNFLVQNGARVILEPGIHVMRDAEFVVNSGGKVVAEDVMIFLEGTKGRLNLNSGSEFDLRAPKKGDYAGIAVFQDRNALTAPHIVNRESSSKIEGVMYVPNNDLHLNSGSKFGQTSPWWAVIARKVETNSGSHIYFNVDYAASDVPVPLSLKIGGETRLTE